MDMLIATEHPSPMITSTQVRGETSMQWLDRMLNVNMFCMSKSSNTVLSGDSGYSCSCSMDSNAAWAISPTDPGGQNESADVHNEQWLDEEQGAHTSMPT